MAHPDPGSALPAHRLNPRFVLDCRYPAGDRERQWEEDEGQVNVIMAAVGLGGGRETRGFFQPPRAQREAAILDAVRIAVDAGVATAPEDGLLKKAIDYATPRHYESVVDYLEVGARLSVRLR